MMSLIPTEAWQYSLIDVFQAIMASIKKNQKIQSLNIDEIGECIPIRSGRVGILIALKALNLDAGSKIGVPFYCCPVVFKAIKMAGHIPIFIDVDDDYCLSLTDLSSKRKTIDALIAVHMFGHTCKMNEILEIMGNKPVIEDAAQSIGSYIKEKPTGIFGKISVFSFRSGKYLSSGEGGAIFTKDKFIKTNIQDSIKELFEPGIKSELFHIAEVYIRSKLRSKPWWGLFGNKIWRIYNQRIEFIDKSPIIMSKAFASDLKITSIRFPKLKQLIRKQRENADYYLHHLKLPKEMLSWEPIGCFYNRFMFPIRFNSYEQCNYFSELLYKNKISSSRPYLENIEGAAKYYGYQKNCPNAERLLLNTLIIPVNYRLNFKEREKIAKIINLGWLAIKKKQA